MKVLSLFDGISCGMVALERANIEVEQKDYFASEIKPIAIKCSQDNYPNLTRIGDVTKVHYWNGTLYTEKGSFDVGKIDLLIGGSPCQNFSQASAIQGDYSGLQGSKSKLFYEFLRILKEVNPKYFLLENVAMSKQKKQMLDDYLGVCGIAINSDLVSFQNRPRIYWSNIPNITIPKDKQISFQDYKENDIEELKKYKVKRTPSREKMWGNGGSGKWACKNITYADKIGCVTRKQDRCPNSGLIEFEDFCRYLTRKEIEMAQTLPIGYTDCLTYNQMQDVCGDGWTVDVIAHIFKGLMENELPTNIRPKSGM